MTLNLTTNYYKRIGKFVDDLREKKYLSGTPDSEKYRDLTYRVEDLFNDIIAADQTACVDSVAGETISEYTSGYDAGYHKGKAVGFEEGMDELDHDHIKAEVMKETAKLNDYWNAHVTKITELYKIEIEKLEAAHKQELFETKKAYLHG